MKKKLLVLATTLLLAVNVVACSKPSTLEEYYAKPIVKEAFEEELNSLKETYSSTYSDIAYSITENKFTYTYTLAEQLEDAAAAAESLETSLNAESLDAQIADIEKETGITGVSVEYVYLNADGSEIFRKTYTKDAE